jgi:hypothetical protein
MKQRSALALAAVLAATVLTGGAAILGIARAPAPVHGGQTAAVVQAPQPASQYAEEGGD